MNIQQAKADIVTTEDLLERALKLSGLVTTLEESVFQIFSLRHVNRIPSAYRQSKAES